MNTMTHKDGTGGVDKGTSGPPGPLRLYFITLMLVVWLKCLKVNFVTQLNSS